MASFQDRVRSLVKNRYSWMLMLALVSLIGFLAENVWSYLATGFIGNRGFILPFLFVYGLGILIIYLILGTPTTKRLPLYILCVYGIITALQIGYGYAVEAIFGFRPWDMSEMYLSVTPYASMVTSLGFAGLISLFMNVLSTCQTALQTITYFSFELS